MKKKSEEKLHPMLHGHHMGHQGKMAKMDESLGMRKGKESTKKQSMKSRRDESEGASHHHKMIKHHLGMLNKLAMKGK
jgi:hypothetical protein